MSAARLAILRLRRKGRRRSRRRSHAAVVGAGAAFGRHPGDVLGRILDVAGLAVDAVGGVDAEHRRAALRRRLRRRRRGSRAAPARRSAGRLSRIGTAGSARRRWTGWSSSCARLARKTEDGAVEGGRAVGAGDRSLAGGRRPARGVSASALWWRSVPKGENAEEAFDPQVDAGRGATPRTVPKRDQSGLTLRTRCSSRPMPVARMRAARSSRRSCCAAGGDGGGRRRRRRRCRRGWRCGWP